MNKKLATAIIALCNLPMAFAGGVLTNTNQSARFARLMALEASTAIDAAYYNPAGLAKLKKDGFHFTFTNQSAFQKRIINSNYSLYKMSPEQSADKRYEGTASAPIIPSLQMAYKKGQWVLSGSFAITGGGGKATFENGVSLFDLAASHTPGLVNQFTSGGMTPNRYSMNQYMTGSNFIYGLQLGGTYEINKMFSAYAGFRLNIVNNSYEGYLRNLQTNLNGTEIASLSAILEKGYQHLKDQEAPQRKINSVYMLMKASEKDGAKLNSKQSGWGIAPIVGFHFSYDKLNIGMKYEFKTGLDTENKTVDDDTGEPKTGMFADGENIAHDIPALFTIGASYDILPQLTVNVGYHHFFDKNAGMAQVEYPNNSEIMVGKEKFIDGTNEYLAGIEYKINKMFLISAGGQITKYGINDPAFQSDLSFYVNSYSIGFGGAVNVSENVQINAGYFWTDYDNYTKISPQEVGGNIINQTNNYTRKNKVFAVGVDFTF